MPKSYNKKSLTFEVLNYLIKLKRKPYKIKRNVLKSSDFEAFFCKGRIFLKKPSLSRLLTIYTNGGGIKIISAIHIYFFFLVDDLFLSFLGDNDSKVIVD